MVTLSLNPRTPLRFRRPGIGPVLTLKINARLRLGIGPESHRAFQYSRVSRETPLNPN